MEKTKLAKIIDILKMNNRNNYVSKNLLRITAWYDLISGKKLPKITTEKRSCSIIPCSDITCFVFADQPINILLSSKNLYVGTSRL